MARSLSEQNHDVEIISSKRNLIDIANGIKINCFAGENLTKRDKVKQFMELLSGFKPEVIICSEPLTVLAARQYSKKRPENIRIVYDITEWYPSKKNLNIYKIPVRWFFFFKLIIFNLWVSGYADSFIFGEWFKSRPYRVLYPHKSFIYTSYYPDLKYLDFCKSELEPGLLRLSYSGKISLEKGYCNFINVIRSLSEYKTDLRIEVKIIGWYENRKDRQECINLFSSLNRNINITIFERQDFISFIRLIKDTDIFLDLRSDDFENQHCLPIKLFCYAALGRPVIFSDLKAIRKEVDIENFGFLADPGDIERIVRLIADYLENPELYIRHCTNARSLAENKYNWQKIESPFLKFITSQ